MTPGSVFIALGAITLVAGLIVLALHAAELRTSPLLERVERNRTAALLLGLRVRELAPHSSDARKAVYRVYRVFAVVVSLLTVLLGTAIIVVILWAGFAEIAK